MWERGIEVVPSIGLLAVQREINAHRMEVFGAWGRGGRCSSKSVGASASCLLLTGSLLLAGPLRSGFSGYRYVSK